MKCGQYIKVGSEYWIVSSLPDNNGIYEKAILWKCKYSIRFISPLTGDIVEYPTYSYNSTQYGTGELQRTNIAVGESQHLLYVPYNEETVLVDNNFRFIMDRNKQNPTVFRVTQVDTTSYAVGALNNDGILQWSILQTQFNDETDNKDLMIADFFKDSTDIIKGESDTTYRIELVDADGDFIAPLG